MKILQIDINRFYLYCQQQQGVTLRYLKPSQSSLPLLQLSLSLLLPLKNPKMDASRCELCCFTDQGSDQHKCTGFIAQLVTQMRTAIINLEKKVATLSANSHNQENEQILINETICNQRKIEARLSSMEEKKGDIFNLGNGANILETNVSFVDIDAIKRDYNGLVEELREVVTQHRRLFEDHRSDVEVRYILTYCKKGKQTRR